MSINRTTKTSSARRPEPYAAPPWAQPSEARTAAGAGPAGEKLVKVNSAQINTIRQQYQVSAAQRARRDRPEKPKPAPAARSTTRDTAREQPARARARRAAELEFRKLAIEVGIERAKALVAEVEQGIAALVSR
jgi:hypothetical protein